MSDQELLELTQIESRGVLFVPYLASGDPESNPALWGKSSMVSFASPFSASAPDPGSKFIVAGVLCALVSASTRREYFSQPKFNR
jgi:hypothetical protein